MNLTFRTYTINLLKFYIGHFKIDRRKLSISRLIHLTHLNTMKLLYENIFITSSRTVFDRTHLKLNLILFKFKKYNIIVSRSNPSLSSNQFNNHIRLPLKFFSFTEINSTSSQDGRQLRKPEKVWKKGEQISVRSCTKLENNASFVLVTVPAVN